MQLKKIVAAGAMGLLMAGSSLAFAANLGDYPAPFVTSAGVQSLVVVGASASPQDVVGAVDLAARLGGSVTQDVKVSGTSAGVSVSGEGRELSTSSTKIYLDDKLGKTGLRTTLTKDDLPTLLKSSSIQDTNSSTTSNFQQFIYLTPGSTPSTAGSYQLQFDKPGSSSSANPSYNFGRFPTSPSLVDYMYKTTITFDKAVASGAAVNGDKLTLFGKEYTVHSDTTFAGGAGSSSNKLVLSGGADSKVLASGESVDFTFGGKTYNVKLVGVSSSTAAVIEVNGDRQSLTKGLSKTVGSLDVYLSDAYYLSSTDQTQNSGKVLLGSQKIVLQHGSKVKVGQNEDSVDGTHVNLTVDSANKLSAFYVAIGGRSSTDDFVQVGSKYMDPVWKTFSLEFPSLSADLTGSSRDWIKVSPSGSNLLTVDFTDDRGNEKAVNWAYKSASTGTAFSLADSSGNAINVLENVSLTQDKYFTSDAGDFTHLFKMGSISADASSSASVELQDVMSGTTIKSTLGTDGLDEKIIDGQSYFINTTGSSTATITWGSGATYKSTGSYLSVYPKLKLKGGEYLALTAPVNLSVYNGDKWNLPTGALSVVIDDANTNNVMLNLTAATTEQSVASVGTSLTSGLNLTIGGASDTFTLGRTATGGVIYNVSAIDNATVTLRVVGTSGTAGLTQPALILVEEKDNNNDVKNVVISASTETSGSDNVAIPSAPTFTDMGNGTAGVTLGSDSTILDYVDYYGVYARRTTSGQDTLTVYYPDEQVSANLVVSSEGSVISSSGASGGSTVKQSLPVKTSLAKLDSEVTQADKTEKNLILVGGPCANSLVADLAAAGKLMKGSATLSCDGWNGLSEQGDVFGLVSLVNDAFTTGKAALVVAGSRAVNTRDATAVLQAYDDHASALAGKMGVLVRGTVVSDLA